MNTSTISLMLQTVAALLTSAHNNAAIAPAVDSRLITLGSQTVQIATQAVTPIGFSTPANTSMYPNATDVANAAYQTANGTYEQLGSAVTLDQDDISFGDLNGDGVDDSAVIVAQTTPSGSKQYAIAMLLNQGGVTFNIADRVLGSSVTVYAHHIVNGILILDMQVAGESRGTFEYQLLGNTIIKL